MIKLKINRQGGEKMSMQLKFLSLSLWGLGISVVGLALLIPTITLADGECEIAKQAIIKAGEIRKLKVKRNVPCYVHTREQVTAFIRGTIDTKIPPKKLEMEELTFKALGVIPESFAYAQGIIDLYLSQIGGYYDPEKKYFIMAGWMPALMQPTIAAHELTHALQDQYFNLEAFIDPKSDNSDEQLAHSALVEGDATAVMMNYMRSMAGQAGIERDRDVNAIMMQSVVGMGLTAASNGIPPAMQMMLIFPYTSGLRFVHHFLVKSGFSGINRIFENPPRSTEEILHPEKYGVEAGEFVIFSDGDFVKEVPQGSSIVYRDTLGEFGISALLSSYLSDKTRVADAAAGWGGDRVVVAEAAPASARTIIWKSNWDTERDAGEFVSAWREVLKKRFPSLEPELDEAQSVGDGHLIKTQHKGTSVTISVGW